MIGQFGQKAGAGSGGDWLKSPIAFRALMLRATIHEIVPLPTRKMPFAPTSKVKVFVSVIVIDEP